MSGNADIRAGMPVYGSDGVRIGTVEQLVDDGGIEVDGLEYSGTAIATVTGDRVQLALAGAPGPSHQDLQANGAGTRLAPAPGDKG